MMNSNYDHLIPSAIEALNLRPIVGSEISLSVDSSATNASTTYSSMRTT